MSIERSPKASDCFTPEIDGVKLADDQLEYTQYSPPDNENPSEYILHSISGPTRLSQQINVGQQKGQQIASRFPEQTRYVSFMSADGSTDVLVYDRDIPMQWRDIQKSGKTPVQAQNSVMDNPADFDWNARVRNARKNTSASTRAMPVNFKTKLTPAA